ncbi:intercellular adhesion molecule 4 [Choloepus didactylus]|uniref:intercellular adhesion molecule 4 n=1 Tax=Choloepus didactylus TaxID=27675 RepID=UPI00189D0553|nr:intercellular adhesion molecule 4 [Choloepus didactylus]
MGAEGSTGLTPGFGAERGGTCFRAAVPLGGRLSLSGWSRGGGAARGSPYLRSQLRLPGAGPLSPGLFAMGSLLLCSLLLLLAVLTPGPGDSPPTPSGTSAAFWVRLSPEAVAVPPGDSVWLNCSSSCPLPASSSLHTQLRQGRTLRGPGWVAYQLLDVRAWSSDVRCLVTCGGETREAKARVTAYKPPNSVILEPPVFQGGEYTLRCHVTHVFPVGFLVVTLRLGGRVIYSESLERFTRRDLANVTLTYAMRSRPGDLWQPVTCHARLNLDRLMVRSTSAPETLGAFAVSPTSKALASTSIAALVGILLALGATYLWKYPAMGSRV